MTHKYAFAIGLLFAATSAWAQAPGLQFSGMQKATLPSTALSDIGTGDFTIEAWVKGEEGPPNQNMCILSNRASGQTGMMFFTHYLWGGSQYKMLGLQMGGMNYLLVNNGDLDGSFLDGTCHHVALARRGGDLRFFVDGVYIGSRAVQGNPSVASPLEDLSLGSDPVSGNWFNGHIGLVRIWNVARSDEEIATQANWIFAGDAPNMVAEWPLNEGVGQTLANMSGADGYLGNSTATEGADPIWTNEGCTLSPVGIPELGAGPQPSVLPSPTNGPLTIDLNETIRVDRLVLTDVQGRTVLESRPGAVRTIDLDLGHLANGTYHATLFTEQGVRTVKVVKQE